MECRPVSIVTVFYILVIFQTIIVQGEICRDNIPNCSTFNENDICQPGRYPKWTKENCEHYCGLCKRTTPCKDKLDDCRRYDVTACYPPYSNWAQENCEKTCGFCNEATVRLTNPPKTSSTTTPEPKTTPRTETPRTNPSTKTPYRTPSTVKPHITTSYPSPTKIQTRPRTPSTVRPHLTPTRTPPATLTPTPATFSSGVSPQDQELIIDMLNDIRANVKPPAKAMPTVVWDQIAADDAKTHTDQCAFTRHEHNATGYDSSQIRTIVYPGSKNWTEAISFWASLGEYFQYGNDYRIYLDKSLWWTIAPYVQLITETVVRVGCAFTSCQPKDFYSCNFLTGHNELRTPYEWGVRCSSCPNSCKNGLCDCGGLLCLDGKKLDVDACTCN